MRLTVVGCSGSAPGPDSAASCYLVEHDGYRVVMDLGNGAIGTLQRYVDVEDVDALFVSHLHTDHFIDICALYVALKYRPQGPPARSLPVYGPPGTLARVTAAYGTPDADENLPVLFDFRTVPTGSFELGPFRATSARMAHPVPCHGLRLDADGHAVAYSGDTGPTPALVDLARGADLLLAEASFRDGDANPPALHLTGAEAGEHAARAGVGQLVVTHVPPWFDRERAKAAAAERFAGPTQAATPGLTVDL